MMQQNKWGINTRRYISYNTFMAIEWFEQAQAAMVDIMPILKALADSVRLAVFQCIRGCWP